MKKPHHNFKNARSIEEVALIMGCSKESVEAFLFKAKRKMKAEAERLGIKPEDILNELK
jgi:DNA-directed RNA polymerase specialized sigma24 family protein